MRGWWRRNALALSCAASWLLATGQSGVEAAYTLDFNSTDSLKLAAKDMADDMMSFYTGNQPGGIPGLLPNPYYWWEAGALMGALIDYWYYTGDTRWNNDTTEGLLFQVGETIDYMPSNQTLTEGNDDQGFWGMAVMSAAEYNFPNPPAKKPQWLALAQAVFNTQASRWDPGNCGGGLRWQIFTWNNGFDYKNTISQGCFFNIGARLALYTGNNSYAEWAEKTWDWTVQAGLLNLDSWYLYDGAHIDNCSNITPYQWTYNAGSFLLGAAAMYNYSTGAEREKWRERVDGLLNGTMVFFTGDKSDIMTEVACEPVNLCDLDQQSFKAYLSRWMAATTKWAPWTFERIKPLLESSAKAAASQCTGGDNKRMCGLRWTDNGKWDGTTGVGQQMAAMEVVLANIIQEVRTPVTNDTGGTSVGDPSAGGSGGGSSGGTSITEIYTRAISAGDKAGAYILTIVFVIAMVAGAIVLGMDETTDKTASDRLSDIRNFAAAGGPALLRKRRRGGELHEKGKALDHSGSDGSSPTRPVQADDLMIQTRHSLDNTYLPVPKGHNRHQSEQVAVSTPVSYWGDAPAAGRARDRGSYPQARRASLRKKATTNAAWRGNPAS
ncbi:hypothetical protein GQ53DRAFT_750518 [Thozetella sp. PMI_491]|nr:hypothetical protein GQ53DRAFT_750518 [Thozetella sp. PMI_491]